MPPFFQFFKLEATGRGGFEIFGDIMDERLDSAKTIIRPVASLNALVLPERMEFADEKVLRIEAVTVLMILIVPE